VVLTEAEELFKIVHVDLPQPFVVNIDSGWGYLRGGKTEAQVE